MTTSSTKPIDSFTFHLLVEPSQTNHVQCCDHSSAGRARSVLFAARWRKLSATSTHDLAVVNVMWSFLGCVSPLGFRHVLETYVLPAQQPRLLGLYPCPFCNPHAPIGVCVVADVLSCWDAFGFSYAWTQRISREKNDQGRPAHCHFASLRLFIICCTLRFGLFAIKIGKSNSTHFVAGTAGPPHEVPKKPVFLCLAVTSIHLAFSVSFSPLSLSRSLSSNGCRGVTVINLCIL